MKNFGIGLALGLIGAILWRVASIINIFVVTLEGLTKAKELFGIVNDDFPLFVLPGEFIFTATDAMYLGLALMIGGPLTYWVILPIIKFIRRRKGE